MMNKGSFKGASLENFTSITIPSEHIPKLFYERRFTEISGHIEEKAKQFHSLYLHLKEVAPTLMMKRLEDFKVKKE